MIPDFDSCYRALQARDARFDGLFFVGVSTTGIYCRPICPARTPQASSCCFYPRDLRVRPRLKIKDDLLHLQLAYRPPRTRSPGSLRVVFPGHPRPAN